VIACGYTYLRVKLAALLKDERGDLSSYLAQGILALAALSLTGVVMIAFTGAGSKELDTLRLTAAPSEMARRHRVPARSRTVESARPSARPPRRSFFRVYSAAHAAYDLL